MKEHWSYAKYLADEVNISTPLEVTTKQIKYYLELIKTKGKYSYVADINSLKSNNPSGRSDFEKPVLMYTVNNYLRNIILRVNSKRNWVYKYI